MADIDQYSFSHKELIELLVKETKVKEGKWALNITFGLGVGAIPLGAGEGHETMPGAMVGVQKIGIIRAKEPINPNASIVDAAELQKR